MKKSIEIDLFCEIGDSVAFIEDIEQSQFDDGSAIAKKGDCYKVVDLVGSGWDLERISGDGPQYLRIINSDMKKYVRILTTNDS